MPDKSVSSPESGNDTTMRAAWPASACVAPVPVPDAIDGPPAPGAPDAGPPPASPSSSSSPGRVETVPAPVTRP